MFSRHHTDKLVYPLLVVALLIFISYRPKYRLRGEMPTFFGFTQNAPDKNTVQGRVAGAYWQSALTDIQWKYPHGHPLPTDPPSEFRLDTKAFGLLAADADMRSLYWRRLQQVWMSPEAWTEHYEWDWSWTNDPFTSASQWLHEISDEWLNKHAPN